MRGTATNNQKYITASTYDYMGQHLNVILQTTVSQQLLSLVGIRKPRFSKQRKWLMKGEIEDSHRHKAINMQTSQESTILMTISGSLWDISTLTNESTLSKDLCSQNEKEKYQYKHCLHFLARQCLYGSKAESSTSLPGQASISFCIPVLQLLTPLWFSNRCIHACHFCIIFCSERPICSPSESSSRNQSRISIYAFLVKKTKIDHRKHIEQFN